MLQDSWSEFNHNKLKTQNPSFSFAVNQCFFEGERSQRQRSVMVERCQGLVATAGLAEWSAELIPRVGSRIRTHGINSRSCPAVSVAPGVCELRKPGKGRGEEAQLFPAQIPSPKPPLGPGRGRRGSVRRHPALRGGGKYFLTLSSYVLRYFCKDRNNGTKERKIL